MSGGQVIAVDDGYGGTVWVDTNGNPAPPPPSGTEGTPSTGGGVPTSGGPTPVTTTINGITTTVYVYSDSSYPLQCVTTESPKFQHGIQKFVKSQYGRNAYIDADEQLALKHKYVCYGITKVNGYMFVEAGPGL